MRSLKSCGSLSGGIRYVHADHLGTPRAITDGAQQTVWLWKLAGDPFDEHAPNTSGYMFNLRFPGQYFDAETGLHYNVRRFYDTGSGRYITSDPIGLAEGLSAYGYVGGNPLGNMDPLGLAWTCSLN